MMDILNELCKQLAEVDLTDAPTVQSIEKRVASAAMLMNGWFYDVDQNKYVKAMNKPERM